LINRSYKKMTVPAVAAHQNVFWLQIAVNESEAVNVFQGAKDLPGNFLNTRQGEIYLFSRLSIVLVELVQILSK
jgi:hypothetical protein